MESDDSDVGDMLDNLLANAEAEEPPQKKTLQELDFNFLDSQENIPSTVKTRLQDDGAVSLIHEGDADSSDEEDRRNFESQTYSECGRNLKNLLKKENTESVPSIARQEKLQTSPLATSTQNLAPIFTEAKKKSHETPLSQSPLASMFNITKKKSLTEVSSMPPKDVYSDPIFGFRLIKPLISSAELTERMRGRTAVTVSKIKSHLLTQNSESDWVIAGVLINRSATKTSQKGSQYCIWKLSDLSEKLNTVSLFLFSGAYKLFWKTTTGTVVGILNPDIMESKDEIDQATISVNNAQKIMILGNSRDMGKCKSSKKNGEPCSNIVNLSRCEYCVYHVKQEYNKASRRADIQSNASGRGFSSSLTPKAKAPLAGIYAQGKQPFTPVLAKRNQKLYEKDSARLALLRGATTLPDRITKVENTEEKQRKACAVELTTHQVKKDLERLNKLRGWNVGKQINATTFAEASELSSSTNISQTKSTSISSKVPAPRLGAGMKNGSIDLSEPVKKNSASSINSQTERKASISSPKSTPRLGAGLQNGNIDLSEPIKKNSSSSSINSQTESKTSISSQSSQSSRLASISSPNSQSSRLGAGLQNGNIDLSEPMTKNLSSSSIKSQINSQTERKSSISSPSSQINRAASISSPNIPVPRLGAGRNGSIDFSEPITTKHVNKARLNAVRWIKENGALKQSNPNKIRESKEKKIEAGAKRRREVNEADEETQRLAKKAANSINDKFKEMMEAKSAHVDLVEKSQDLEKEKYFETLEIKERMEEKMMTTFKVDCKAVKCLICKYTSFSASDLCKEQKHPLRVINAVKSFFKCSDCGNRTVSLDRIPSQSCKKCSGSHWVRAAMMAEKKTEIVGAKLSIRGGEEKFIGSVAQDANINLCVPDTGTGTS